MPKRIRVTAIYNKEPDVRLYVLALIELARQLQQDEQASHRAPQKPGAGGCLGD